MTATKPNTDAYRDSLVTERGYLTAELDGISDAKAAALGRWYTDRATRLTEIDAMLNWLGQQ